MSLDRDRIAKLARHDDVPPMTASQAEQLARILRARPAGDTERKCRR